MQIVRTVEALRHQVGAWRAAGQRVALVPTMGALHAGHMSLVDLALSRADKCVMSIFVNPTQFAPNEDFEAYPRREAEDVSAFEAQGGHLVFAPDPATMYPPGFATSLSVAGPALGLEEAFRPAHFDGVALVVAKLLNAAGANVAVFGEKDYQQLQVITRMVADLDISTEIVGAPIVRDEEGLALSSRNAYLTAEQVMVARHFNKRLHAAAMALARDDGHAAETIVEMARKALLDDGFDKVDYVAARAADLGPFKPGQQGRVLGAAWLGKTRLIDNIAVPPLT